MRLVATDIDGTIVPHGGTVSAATKTAFAQCAARGVDVVLVTGRPKRWLPDIFAQLDFTGSAICSNGAVVVHGPELTVVEHQPLPDAHLQQLHQAVTQLWPAAWVAVETLSGMVCAQVPPPNHDVPDDEAPTVVADVAAVLAQPDVLKVLVRVPGHDPDHAMSMLAPLVVDVAEVTHSNPHDNLLEIAPVGVTKASTLARYCARAGVAQADVVAFGDMPNDVPMLAWAGTGFAMLAGHAAAVAAADQVAPACVDDGVARIIQQQLGITPPGI